MSNLMEFFILKKSDGEMTVMNIDMCANGAESSVKV
jgi:hypothetical protein